jgi:mono/diheme cytochrome c family protein
VGATIVKSFSAPGRRGGRQLLETRLIKRIESGWEAATYLWQGDDARLLPQGRQFERYTRAGVTTWHAPSSAECSTCHVESAGFALGLESSQLNRTDATGRNQIERWLAEGVAVAPDGVDWKTVAPRCDPYDEGAPLADRARSWLDTNCAMCHRPNGTGNAAIDLRLGTPLEETGLVNGLPGQGDFGLEDARLVAPGSPERSVLLHRVTTLGDGRMPNLGSHVVDAEGAALLEDWIRSL